MKSKGVNGACHVVIWPITCTSQREEGCCMDGPWHQIECLAGGLLWGLRRWLRLPAGGTVQMSGWG